MRNKMSKVLSVVFVLLLAILLLPGRASAVEIVGSGTFGAEGDNLTWMRDREGILTISGTGDMENFEYSFAPWNDIIWDEGTEPIRTVVVESGVTSLGDFCFYGSASLTNVTLPDSVISLGDSCFDRCTSLISVTLPDSVTSLGDSCFEDCTSLTSVTLADGITSLGWSCFKGCTSLDGITLPDSVTILLYSCFEGCTGLTNITLPDSLTTMKGSCFEGCTSLTSITLTNSITYLDSSCFEGCTSLTSVTLPDRLTGLSFDCFKGCASLTSITIPDSVTSLDSTCFSGCTSLTEINIGANNPQYRSLDGIVYNKDGTELICCPAGKAGEAIIPDSVTSLGDSCFSGCTQLTSITLPDSVTSLGYECFSECTSLTSIVLPDSVTSLGRSCFNGCTSLTSINIPGGITTLWGCFSGCASLTSIILPDGLTTMKGYCFTGCTSLTSITIPDSVIYMSTDEYTGAIVCFSGCTSLTQINVAANNPEYSSVDGIVYNKDGTKLLHCPEGKTGEVMIPEGVTELMPHCFRECVNLTSVILPEGITHLGRDSFVYCTNLISINIPDGTTVLGYGAFAYCSSLSSIMIPDSVTVLDWECFVDCTSLASIIFCGNVPEIKGKILRGVTATAYFPEGNPTWTKDKLQDYGGNITWKPYTNCFVNGHAEVTDKAVAPTCTTTGLTEGKHCSVCGEILVKQETVKALGHTEVIDKADAPTCTETGLTEGKHCSVCGEILVKQEVVKALGHNYKTQWNQGNAQGHWHDCTRCDAHSEAEAHVPNVPAATEDTAKYCTVCGYVMEAQLNHTHKPVLVKGFAASCTENGRMDYYTCHCGKWFTDTEGKTEITDTSSVILPKLGHTEVIDKAVAPSCTETGLTEGSHCETCGEVLTAQQEIPALGHDYVNEVCTRCREEDPAAPKITRIAGSDRHETAFKIANQLKKVLNVEKFDTILIASGSDSADALAGSYLAARMSAPIFLSRGNSHARNLEYIQANLAEGGIVYILGGTAAVPEEMENLLKDNNIPYERLKGKTRFDTNLAILDKAGVVGDEILVSTGYNFADSLSASASGKPILLLHTNANVLTDSQKVWLEGQRGKTFTIIGGTGAVSEELETALRAYGTTARLKGSGREATSVEVAKKFFTTPNAALLAYSRNFPDGLCGGPLAYAMKAPLLLVNAGKEADANGYVNQNGIRQGYILGGTGVISDNTARTVFGLDSSCEIPKQ